MQESNMSGSGNGVSVPTDIEGVLVHQNIINGAVYFFATRNGVEIDKTEIRQHLPEGFLNIFDERHELDSERYIKSCEIIGLKPIRVDFLIPKADIERLRQAAYSGNQYECEVADDLIKLAMVMPDGFEDIGSDYDKDALISSSKRRIHYANKNNRFDVGWYENVFSRLEKILVHQ